MKADIRKSLGFTLMEILIVVAIISVLVAVSIPVLSGSLEKVRETTCLANRTSLDHELIYSVVLAEGTVDDVMNEYTQDKILEKGYVCPDKKGKIRLSYDPVSHKFSVYCSAHGGLEVTYDFANVVGQFMDGGLEEKIVGLLGTRTQLPQIDSSAAGGGNFAKPIAEKLMELTNHSIGKGMTTTWSLCDVKRAGNTIQNNYKLYWSSVDITSCKQGDSILMMKYDASTDRYQAGWVTVKENKDNTVGGGKPYNVIDQGTFKPIPGEEGSTDTEFMPAYQKFQAALNSDGNDGKDGTKAGGES